MNYTRPNDPDHIDDPKEWLYGALVFSRALGLIIHEGEGIVIDLVGDMKHLYPKAKRVIVHSNGENVTITNATERDDLKEGDIVQMIDSNIISN